MTQYPILDPPDDELIRRVAKSDQSALEEIIRRWSRPVYSLALRILRDPEAAKEVSQDVFLKCWSQARRFDRVRGAFSSWILTLAHHSAIDHLRRARARGRDSTTLYGPEAAAGLAAPGGGVTPWQKLRMEKALARLNEDQRQAIEMAYFEGLTREEMAGRLKEPVGTVKTRLRDTLSKLKKIYSDPDEGVQS